MTIYLDFESCCDTDLVEEGLGKYAADPSLNAYLCLWTVDDQEEVRTQIDDELRQRIEHGEPIVAHNAGFDRSVWNATTGVRTEVWQWRDTAAIARYNGLPGSLEAACRRLGIEQQKDMEGAKVLEKYYKVAPQGEDLARITVYGKQDVIAMRALHRALGDLPPRELAIMHADMACNERGLPVDTAGAMLMGVFAEMAKTEAARALSAASSGVITAATQYPALLAYAKTHGYPMSATDKGAVESALADIFCPEQVRNVLEQWRLSTTAPRKHAAILTGSVRGRLSHTLVYHGAIPTGRWTARGGAQFQGHNFTRPRAKFEGREEEIYQAVKRGDWGALCGEFAPPLAALADCQRHMIRAEPGMKIVAADLSAIEARIMPWLTDEQEVLDVFRDGKDLYAYTAAVTYGVTYEEAKADKVGLRQRGKVIALALAGAGGVDALESFCRVYRLHMSDKDKARAVALFRAARPALNAFWVMMDQALALALDPINPQTLNIQVGPEQSVDTPVRLGADGALRIGLPSGRDMVFRDAAMREIDGTWYPTYVDPYDAITKIDRAILSIGFVQSIARDLFGEIMIAMRAENYDMIHHVHDEMVFHVEEARAEKCLARMLELMATPPAWLPGIPLKGEGFVDDFWHK